MNEPRTSSRAAFRLTDVCREVDGTAILDHITVDIPERKLTALIGPSGAGKSSLLRLLNRLDDPTSGVASYRGVDLAAFPVRELRSRIGFVFQIPLMFPGTVRENLTVAAQIARLAPSATEDRMRASLELAELGSDFLDRETTHLSVGQQQRVSIARTLMTGPETLLLDEPTASLDPETAERLMSTIGRLSRDEKMTIVVATHRLWDARDRCEFAVMLDEGRLVDAGEASAIFERSTHPRIRSFLETVS